MNETPLIRDELDPAELAVGHRIFADWRRPVLMALAFSLASVTFGCLWGCKAGGSSSYMVKTPLGDWGLVITIKGPEKDELPAYQTFVDPVMDWLVTPITGGSTGADGSTQVAPPPVTP